MRVRAYRLGALAFPLAFLFSSAAWATPSPEQSRDQWGAPSVEVSRAEGCWTITGKRNTVRLNETDLSMTIEAGSATWEMVPSSDEDVSVQFRGERFHLRLADAGRIEITPYNTGYKTGVKIRLDRFRSTGLMTKGLELDLALVLTVALEGEVEELVCDCVAMERGTAVRRLDWPKRFDASDVDYTLLPHDRGVLLPRDWPNEYYPFRMSGAAGKESEVPDRLSVIQSNLIECWSMAWWGFVRGESALILMVETSDDGSYTFSHPAGGPTAIGPRWLASLGKLRYPRSVRICFFERGNYVTLAKRYRQYVMDTGHFVSLKEKIARDPYVEKLVGAPHLHQWVMFQKRSFTALGDTAENAYASTHVEPKEGGFSFMTFDVLAEQLRDLKAQGLDRCNVILAGWPTHGYDTNCPDSLPPSPPAGGFEGMRRWTEACNDLGYISSADDQYRDYYVNAPSYDRQFAVHEEDAISRSIAFPGTRFGGGWKEGHVPLMNYWAGGDNTYLNARFGLGHLRKNYQALLRHGIKPRGIYFDVMGYVPPTEDFNPEHPMTRGECMRYRALMFQWARNNRGCVGAEAGADWVVPYLDYTLIVREGRGGISVPLYNLVYHDAIMTPSGGLRTPLRCLLNGSFATLYKNPDMKMLRTINSLHRRVALLEMTNHEFLDKGFRKERSTFSDGTTVTIDRAAETFDIVPPLQ